MKKSIMGIFAIVLVMAGALGGMALTGFDDLEGLKRGRDRLTGTVTQCYTMSTETAVELRDSLCANGRYQSTVDDGQGNEIPNPVSCVKYAKMRIQEFPVEEILYHRRAIHGGNWSEYPHPEINVTLNPVSE